MIKIMITWHGNNDNTYIHIEFNLATPFKAIVFNDLNIAPIFLSRKVFCLTIARFSELYQWAEIKFSILTYSKIMKMKIQHLYLHGNLRLCFIIFIWSSNSGLIYQKSESI